VKVLSIDIETYSETNLKTGGVYRYAYDPAFRILILSYSIDYGKPVVVDLASGEKVPSEIVAALTDDRVLKKAYNAMFERVCLGLYYGKKLDARNWECTMIRAAMAGLPFGLDAALKAAGLDIEKQADGKKLISYFSVPCKPTKANGMRTRNLPEHDYHYWDRYLKYCGNDVAAENELSLSLESFPIPENEKKLYALDQSINDRGVMVDLHLAEMAVKLDRGHRERLTSEAYALTGLDNPNSAQQVSGWLENATGKKVDTLRKADVKQMLEDEEDDDVTAVLKIRQGLSKTSIKKYEAVLNSAALDFRVRGLFQFYGANRTGRWAGRLVQVQNLPKNSLTYLDTARAVVKTGSLETAEMVFDSVPDTLSQLIRTVFVPKAFHTFIVTDFSAIEARVLAWLAGEKWRLDVFNGDGKIYEASAAQMFKVPVETISKGSDLRQKGKVSELALGYQGAGNALIAMGALEMGLKVEELDGLVNKWRAANPKIVKLWYSLEAAAVEAVEYGTEVSTGWVKFKMQKGHLLAVLPSGRQLVYRNAKLRPNSWGKNNIVYEGVDQLKKTWGRIVTYGGKLAENITQAIARDCLAVAMQRLDDNGFSIVMHVHDEAVIEYPLNFYPLQDEALEKVNGIMATPMPWAPGLPLRGDSFVTNYYKKD
jgi:DNA polymerase